MPKDSLSLELVGKINLVSRKGKKVTREELDGKLCLEAIVHAMSVGLRVIKDNLK
jgi:hypothetical protein